MHGRAQGTYWLDSWMSLALSLVLRIWQTPSDLWVLALGVQGSPGTLSLLMLNTCAAFRNCLLRVSALFWTVIFLIPWFHAYLFTQMHSFKLKTPSIWKQQVNEYPVNASDQWWHWTQLQCAKTWMRRPWSWPLQIPIQLTAKDKMPHGSFLFSAKFPSNFLPMSWDKKSAPISVIYCKWDNKSMAGPCNKHEIIRWNLWTQFMLFTENLVMSICTICICPVGLRQGLYIECSFSKFLS